MTQTNDLPKPTDQPDVISREVRKDATDEVRLLAAVGAKIAPDGTKYVGTMAIHAYVRELANEYVLYTQTAGLGGISEQLAQTAVKELTRHVMLKYGHTPPAKIGDAMEREER